MPKILVSESNSPRQRADGASTRSRGPSANSQNRSSEWILRCPPPPTPLDPQVSMKVDSISAESTPPSLTLPFLTPSSLYQARIRKNPRTRERMRWSKARRRRRRGRRRGKGKEASATSQELFGHLHFNPWLAQETPSHSLDSFPKT